VVAVGLPPLGSLRIRPRMLVSSADCLLLPLQGAEVMSAARPCRLDGAEDSGDSQTMHHCAAPGADESPSAPPQLQHWAYVFRWVYRGGPLLLPLLLQPLSSRPRLSLVLWMMKGGTKPYRLRQSPLLLLLLLLLLKCLLPLRSFEGWYHRLCCIPCSFCLTKGYNC
jgi:hypothetical protein